MVENALVTLMWALPQKGGADGFASVLRVEAIRKQRLVTVTEEEIRKLAVETVPEAVGGFSGHF